jgi:chloride channel 3/4/5
VACSLALKVGFLSQDQKCLFILLYTELDIFSKEADTMWRGFVISVIAAVSLQYTDPFGTKKMVLFQVGCVCAYQAPGLAETVCRSVL